jgi:F0F1-type ATP synthase assembly protein I
MKPDNNPLSTYGIVAGVVGQAGCLILLVVLGSMLVGFVLDQIFGTKPTFLFVSLLVSLPVTIAVIFLYTRYKTKELQDISNQKEEDISE